MKKLFLITFLFMAMMFISVTVARAQCTYEHKKPTASTAYTDNQRNAEKTFNKVSRR